MPVSPVPADARVLIAYLVVKNAAAAISFYQQAFDATELFRLVEPSGKVGHAELNLFGSRVMLADEYPDFGALSPVSLGGTPVTLHQYVEDVDGLTKRAEEAGAIVLRPPTLEFYGDRVAQLMDPFGHKWLLASRQEEVSVEEMQRRFTAALS